MLDVLFQLLSGVLVRVCKVFGSVSMLRSAWFVCPNKSAMRHSLANNDPDEI